MLDANTELDGLRQRLRLENLSDNVIDELIKDASREISVATADILADAMNDAVNAGGEMQSTEFIDEIRTIRTGSGFDIITDSGRTDFSEPPFPMLPSLLKNAKVAKDGSSYKVIPIRRKGNKSKQKVAVTTEAALQEISDARHRAREEKEAEKESSRSLAPDAMKGGDVFAAMMNLSGSRQKVSGKKERSTEPVMDFKTASSKQDPNTQWVHPGRTIDMGSKLREINMSIHDNIDNAIKDIIRKYDMEY
jgi:vacuolar-type H+-ATPase subunit H